MIKNASIQDSLNNLIGKTEIKNILEEINNVCMNSNQDIKKGIPNLFIIAKPGSGVNYIADIYSEIVEYSCAVKPQFREIGNRLTGTWEPPYASLLAHVFV